jgi:sugar lactone lactonase YvrE
MTEGFSIPNSLAWSPDGTTMYLADSLQHAISSYDFAPETGAIGVQRPFARTQAPAIPDGSTVDADGCLWNAEYDGWRIVRYAPGGTIDRVVDLPVQRPTSCAFGGANLDVLYITTASQRLTDEERARQPLAGAVLALDVGVRGLPEPRYTG